MARRKEGASIEEKKTTKKLSNNESADLPQDFCCPARQEKEE